jgi:hypothetical protein
MTKTQLGLMAAHLKLLLLEDEVKIITVTAATEQVVAVSRQRKMTSQRSMLLPKVRPLLLPSMRLTSRPTLLERSN